MRENKYRGKRIDNGEWIYGSLLDVDIIVSGPVDVDEDYIGLGEWCSVDPIPLPTIKPGDKVKHSDLGQVRIMSEPMITVLKDKAEYEVYLSDLEVSHD